MRTYLFLSLNFIFCFAISGVAQEQGKSYKKYYIAVSADKGKTPTARDSYGGALLETTGSQGAPINLWESPSKQEGKGMPGIGAKAGLLYSPEPSAYLIGLEILAEYSKIDYSHHAGGIFFGPVPATQNFRENNFKITFINIIPRIKAYSNISRVWFGYIGAGVVLSKCTFHEKIIFTNFDSFLDESWSYRFDNTDSQYKLGGNGFIGVELKISAFLAMNFEYDYLYLAKTTFELERNEISGERIDQNGNVYGWSAALEKRKRYFRLASTTLRLGLHFFL